jgi:glycosyltransferase involved in cell wall biosynthesis
MPRIAFYAPLKPPDDPVPSGDRTFARALMAALKRTSLGEPYLASRLRSRDGKGDAVAQDAILRAAEAEIVRLQASGPPALWLTYHSYYKAPDLLGPALCRRWGIPYVLVEATRAKKRLDGPYARFAAAAEAACDAADVIFHVTEHDREALERYRPQGQMLVRLRPFLDREALAEGSARPSGVTMRLLACGMFRPGDKLASYGALAAALALVKARSWTLAIIGDGPEAAEVKALFSQFGGRVTFTGALDQAAVAGHFRAADLLVWPGVGEAFGMVYLEAQAEGCPVLAEDRPGVRDVVRGGGWLVPPGNAVAYAAAIDRLAADPGARRAAGQRGRAEIAAEHLIGSARATLEKALLPLLSEKRS